ncbi:MAG: methyltransferase domain-containing protein [Burkholderiales bacterium]
MGGWLDRRAARRWFERAGAAPAGDPLAREVERRMGERLVYLRHEPGRILNVGSGAATHGVLRGRYPRAEIVAVDFAAAPLRLARDARPLAARARALLRGAEDRYVCADSVALPFARGTFQMVWSNLALAWSDVEAALREWHRVLAVDGLLMFTTYGPDTLLELRAAFADTVPHVHPFADMHDLGDALVAAGFADPVMDMERITLTYTRVEDLVADLRATGQRNAHGARRRTLTGAGRWRGARAAYAALARDGRMPASFEIVYGHAWKAAPRATADGRAIVRFDRNRGRGKPG